MHSFCSTTTLAADVELELETVILSGVATEDIPKRPTVPAATDSFAIPVLPAAARKDWHTTLSNEVMADVLEFLPRSVLDRVIRPSNWRLSTLVNRLIWPKRSFTDTVFLYTWRYDDKYFFTLQTTVDDVWKPKKDELAHFLRRSHFEHLVIAAASASTLEFIVDQLPDANAIDKLDLRLMLQPTQLDRGLVAASRLRSPHNLYLNLDYADGSTVRLRIPELSVFNCKHLLINHPNANQLNKTGPMLADLVEWLNVPKPGAQRSTGEILRWRNLHMQLSMSPSGELPMDCNAFANQLKDAFFCPSERALDAHRQRGDKVAPYFVRIATDKRCEFVPRSFEIECEKTEERLTCQQEIGDYWVFAIERIDYAAEKYKSAIIPDVKDDVAVKHTIDVWRDLERRTSEQKFE